jgi:hypothetical protein
VTVLLNQAIAQIEKLPEIQQDRLALILLREIEDRDWILASAKGLARAYSDEEPEYSESDLRK